MNMAVARRAALGALISAGLLGAQQPARIEPPPADAAIARGRLDIAEQELFSVSMRAPREPSARGALGLFLASRGQLKAGAVLLEEARQFGGDAGAIDARLARIYPWYGAWNLVSMLPSARLFDPAENDRARWLAAHQGTANGPDSVVVRLEPNEAAGFGRIALNIGGTIVPADIDPNVDGVVLPAGTDVLGSTQLFGTLRSGGVTLGAAYSVSIGALTLTNVPVRIDAGGHARIGFDVLSPFTPTFDAPAEHLTLRQHGAAPMGAESFAFVLGFPGIRIAARPSLPLVPIESAAGRAALRGARWTFNLRRGVVTLER
jgi:hypothetical protein